MPTLNGLNFEIPEGFFDIPDDSIVEKDDKVASVTYGTDYDRATYKGTTTRKLAWIKVDDTEIGKIKKYSGRIVIRKI